MKRPDKTSGRKAPQTAGLDVVPAGDADQEVAASLEVAICHGQEDAVETSEDELPASTSSAYNIDVADMCGASKYYAQPAKKIGARKSVLWIQCDKCDDWFHTVCVGCRGRSIPASFVCKGCK